MSIAPASGTADASAPRGQLRLLLVMEWPGTPAPPHRRNRPRRRQPSPQERRQLAFPFVADADVDIDAGWPGDREVCRAGGIRPCPYIRCRHHLLVDVAEDTGALVFNVNGPGTYDRLPVLSVGRGAPAGMSEDEIIDAFVDALLDGRPTCSLDIADSVTAGDLTHEDIAKMLSTSAESVRRAESSGLAKARRNDDLRDFSDDSDEAWDAARAMRQSRGDDDAAETRMSAQARVGQSEAGRCDDADDPGRCPCAGEIAELSCLESCGFVVRRCEAHGGARAASGALGAHARSFHTRRAG